MTCKDCVCFNCDGIHEQCPDTGCLYCPDSKDCPSKYIHDLLYEREFELIGDIESYPPVQWDRATLKRHMKRKM